MPHPQSTSSLLAFTLINIISTLLAEHLRSHRTSFRLLILPFPSPESFLTPRSL
ncbi:hypothetical protein BDQ12DRAFT_682852 [Crucibulum laeve]|uniref:Uncharacterized protein n=1 Tax=Crucibulum laeve TaxID=68775 RepID=A0A5C3M2H3_9AGAR|nr:hypothetical protein BDQ12DRAFT_682852 [Crucibulum laeve]